MNADNLGSVENQNSPIKGSLNRKVESIRKEIYKVLGDSGIDVHLKDGNVRLTGQVDDEATLRSVESSIKEIPGVFDVTNELTVKSFNS